MKTIINIFRIPVLSRNVGGIFRSFTVVIASFTAVILVANPFFSLADMQFSKTWSSQSDWTGWTGFGQNLVFSTDQNALVLPKSGSAYNVDGTITNHFSTNGLSQWNSVIVTSKNTSDVNKISLKLSSQPISASNPGVDDPKTLPPSSDLYLSLNMVSDGISTPILQSILLTYESNANFPKIYLEKKIFKFSADGASVSKDPTATFDPYDKAMVQIKIVTSGDTDAEISLRDYLPNGIDTSMISGLDGSQRNLCNLGPSDQLLSGGVLNPGDIANGYLEKDSLSVSKNTTTYLCYSYRIPNETQAKNDLDQVRAIAFEKQPDNSLNLVASSNYYLMIKGYALSDSDPNDPQYLTDRAANPVDDVLSLSFINILYNQNSTSNYLGSALNYIYKKGLAGKSRGGDLYNLPVQMTNNYSDPQDKIVLASDSSYLLYNPVFYLFGNIFSGSNSVSSSLDLGSHSSAVTSNSYSSSNKNNSSSSLYDYNFDKNSVVYWDKDSSYKNSVMSDNIKKILGSQNADGSYNLPSGVCNVSKSSLQGQQIFLNNDCQGGFNSPPLTSAKNPQGTVWYYAVSSDEGTVANPLYLGPSDESKTTSVSGNGTIVIDFTKQTDPNAELTISSLHFDSEAAMGLIVINGGNVLFGPSAQEFQGIIFAPGK